MRQVRARWLPGREPAKSAVEIMSKDTLLENYADVDDISRRLGIHPESVRRLIRDGKLPAIKFGNKWLVEKSVLEQFASGYDGRPGNKATLF